ncbi:MAG: hypothetical protein HYY06_09310 [Deltaproteobacteria bacterium]|nr:hypothetical protein [Deltaproteobacteria bacterium]
MRRWIVFAAALAGCIGGPDELERETGAVAEGECRWPVEVVVWDSKDWMRLGRQFAADPSPCADYYLSIPGVVGDKTRLRQGAAEDIRALGPELHAMAEFHWTTWSRWVESTGNTWYEAGREFRRRMVEAGYDTAAGDTWAINELPSSMRKNTAGARTHARNAVRGLYEGDGEPLKGAVFIVGMGQGTTNFSVYKPQLEQWLCDADFWVDMNRYVRWWGQEVYADPERSCFDAQVGTRSPAINEFIQHVPRLAAAGPSCANTAQSYLDRAYVPLLGAAWQQATGFGDTRITLDQMKAHVSTQIYAARAWANGHAYPDGRIGFAWAPGDDGPSEPEDLDELAARMASAVSHAYGDGDTTAAHACSPSGAYTFCGCRIPGAARNTGWSTFSRW